MTDVLKRRDTETGKQKEKTKTRIGVMYLTNFRTLSIPGKHRKL